MDGNISIDFYYDAVNSDGYSIDNVILNYSFNSENVSIEVGNNSQDVINIQNLIPLTQYYNIELEFISSECGNLTYSYNNFTTPALYDVGDVGAGGVVIYMYPNGVNGIVASEIDAGLAQWACDTTNNYSWYDYNNDIDDYETTEKYKREGKNGAKWISISKKNIPNIDDYLNNWGQIKRFLNIAENEI